MVVALAIDIGRSNHLQERVHPEASRQAAQQIHSRPVSTLNLSVEAGIQSA